ncbi:Eco57I restriction-modification methylase domain-containing protein [Halorubrum sp. PV6]|uniref:Eco57I restriction-modification methylase domain-containing protein n=1 Tax=Halorubrum sp. PV6 TaxID=634157 RepID=UPI000F8574D0|nr:N-6 DNA methylase [Halorubrum sp. PV6]AZQ14894.1 restriction endonuclease [Halorubrum sp. PV6]
MSQATLGSGPYRNSSLFSGYYLDERVADLDAWDCDAEAEEAFEQIRDLWNQEGALLPSYKEDELIDTWIAEVLDILGYGTSSEVTLPDGGGYVDRLLFESKDVRRESARQALDSGTEGHFSRALSILEAKQWDADFEKFFSEQRSYRDASHQVKFYLERTPGDLNWGILTDGKKWRLYGTKDYETQTYYEVDLPEILESGNVEAFKYFYVFFRPGAFVETAGSSFLDDVWSESETAAQELGEDLQDNVFRALRVLGKGFVESNDLEIDPNDEDGLSADELKEQSLVLLYRLMFVLYAESRGLIDPDDPAASEEYQEYFSLEAKREEILDEVDGLDVESGAAFEQEFSQYSSSIWGRLSELFELIDEGEEDLDIPPYNGGLFSRDDHAFLTENDVKDPYIAEVIFWLSTTENDKGEHVPADYADLDTRHLGSIYEGLLEHEFRIAGPEGVAAVAEDGGQVWKSGDEVSVSDAVEVVDEGGLYVVNDEGERKATGAYYTPDYVVTYIVEETVDPLLDEIHEDLRAEGYEPETVEYAAEFFNRIQELSILDPAMGSGHFLTKATGYLSKQVMDEVRALDEQAGFLDEQHIRRQISKEVIYGVDINEMAVELSKLSMWLETLAADQPLAFLDHHVKPGNSLVGSDITEVLSDDGPGDDDGQITLTQAFARVRQDTLEHVMDLMADLLAYDNETLDEIKSMEELYDEIRDDPLYKRLFELANVHTAEEFGCDVPEGAYEQMAGAIEAEDDWAEIREEPWFKSAQATAAEQDFFHWELEFPEVFFDAEGEKMGVAGFDAVVGNPPYVRQEQITQLKPYLKVEYDSYRSSADLYVYFIEKATQILSTSGDLGYITSNKFMRAEYGRNIREYLRNNIEIRSLLDFGELPVFDDASTFPLIFIGNNQTVSEQSVTVTRVRTLSFSSLKAYEEDHQYTVSNTGLKTAGWSLAPQRIAEIHDKIEQQSTALGDYINDEIHWGIKTGLNEAFILDRETRDQLVSQHEKSKDLIQPLVIGDDIRQYNVEYSDQYLLVIKSGWTGKRAGTTAEEDAWKWFSREYPAVADHLSEFEEKARERYDQGEFWWELRPCDYYHEFEESKIIYPEIAMSPRFAIDDQGYYPNNKCYVIPEENYFLLAVLNSKLLFESAKLRVSVLGDEQQGGRLEMRTTHVKDLPIVEISGDSNASQLSNLQEHLEDHSFNWDPDFLNRVQSSEDSVLREYIGWLARQLSKFHSRKFRLNTNFRDYISDQRNKSVTSMGLVQPVSKPNSPLSDTAETYPNLRVGTARVDRESPNTVLVEATARYKPDDEDAHETDRWGYTETEYLPAFRITDLTEREADLIEHFVPVAVDEAGGFANFRETATKTNSLIDRLKAIELPDVDDVADDLENYLETKERAEELDAKIEQTDALIDEIVYELYGLTDGEIEIVEEAVGEN